MAANYEGDIISLVAYENLEPNRLVNFVSGSGTHCELTDATTTIGQTMGRAEAGEHVAVRKARPGDYVMVESAGAVSLGAGVYIQADGKIDDAANGTQIGIARSLATGAGQTVLVQIISAAVAGSLFSVIKDTNDNEAIRITATGSAVNDVTVINAATGQSPKIQASGDDANVGLILKGKGTGTIELQDSGALPMFGTARVGSAVNHIVAGNAITSQKPYFQTAGEDDIGIIFKNKNGEEMLVLASQASSANELTVTSAPTGEAVAVDATGADTNVSLAINPKGAGALMLGANALTKRALAVATNSATLAAADVLKGVLEGTPTGAATYTLPTAALLVAAIPDCMDGMSFDFILHNKAGGAHTITVAAGDGGAAAGTLTVAQNAVRRFVVWIVDAVGSPAYKLYGL